MSDARRIAGMAVALTVVIGLAFDVEAACPPFPDVPWWETSHAKTRSYVKSKYGGDWAPYIAKWEKNKNRMEGILDRDGTAVLKSRKLKMRGKALEDHIAGIAERIEISRCLAAEEEGGEEVAPAQAYTCPPVPEVDWWGDIDHDSMIRFVNDRHNGVWWPYKDR